MKVLLGVSGGIACYKAVELVRVLQERGAEVQVVMTKAAEQFVTPLTFSSITGKRVLTTLWNDYQPEEAAGSIEHMVVAQNIDVFVIAPATANVIAKLAHGMTSDYLTTVALATKAPLIVAPAMNVNMWQHPATQANVEVLQRRGVRIVPPESGYLACGMQGGGRLAQIELIADAVTDTATPPQDLTGEIVLITAGGTREPIDPVRYLGNRSSGKMGHALAEVASNRGAKVILVTASPLPVPPQIHTVRITTAVEMEAAVLDCLPQANTVIMAAAIADFRPKIVHSNKLRRSGDLTLELVPTEDITAKIVARRNPETLVVAFAAETESLEENARLKLARKGADAIVANDVSLSEIGFDSNSNAGLFITANHATDLPIAPKEVFAARILDEVAMLRRSRSMVGPQ